MNLLYDAFEPCVMLIGTDTKPDGSGGTIPAKWVEGRQFIAAFDFNTSMVAKIAEKQGVKGLWNVLLPKDVTLEFHNVFKRTKDGQIFRVTSKDDKITPKGAGLNLRLVSVEEWELV